MVITKQISQKHSNKRGKNSSITGQIIVKCLKIFIKAWTLILLSVLKLEVYDYHFSKNSKGVYNYFVKNRSG